MNRPLTAILAALEFVAPQFEPAREAAIHLRALAIEHQVDPLTIVAIVRAESGWVPSAINPRSGARGLGQIMPSNYGECRREPAGPECEKIKSDLLDWKFNLSETARVMHTWRDYCGKKVGSRLAIHWLPGYQGLDSERRATCGHRKVRGRWAPLKSVPKFTRAVLARRHELERRFGKIKR